MSRLQAEMHLHIDHCRYKKNGYMQCSLCLLIQVYSLSIVVVYFSSFQYSDILIGTNFMSSVNLLLYTTPLPLVPSPSLLFFFFLALHPNYQLNHCSIPVCSFHQQNCVVFSGFQMLRCKLGCSRPSGKKVFNSHYHCCVCGHICIRKSGLYEHMRVQHADLGNKNSAKSDSPCCEKSSQKKLKSKALPDKESTMPVVVQLPTANQLGSVQPERPGNQQLQPSTQAFVSQVQTGGTGNQLTVQIPQVGEGQSNQGQQQLVIVMPQQLSQGQSTNNGQSQQPIVIVMPQCGTGQLSQPIVVPVPQNTNS